jgi:hypothetical protein
LYVTVWNFMKLEEINSLSARYKKPRNAGFFVSDEGNVD